MPKSVANYSNVNFATTISRLTVRATHENNPRRMLATKSPQARIMGRRLNLSLRSAFRRYRRAIHGSTADLADCALIDYGA